MKRIMIVSFCLLIGLSSVALAHERLREKARADRVIQDARGIMRSLDMGGEALFSTAQVETVVLASYTFDSSWAGTPEGWTSHDITEQPYCYWHVDDFSGLGGGTHGCYTPPEGLQALWCGARPDPDDPVLRHYASLPGYGNNWNQGWCFRCIEVPETAEVYIDYLAAWDSEVNYDVTYLEYATDTSCAALENVNHIDDWVELHEFDSPGPDSCVCPAMLIHDTIPAGHDEFIRIRFRFVSDMGASDEDGGWDSDGAFIMDSVTVRDGTGYVHDYEDFETESVGSQVVDDGDWTCCNMSGYGHYAGLFSGSGVVQEDYCGMNRTWLWAFIKGSTATYECGGYPEQRAVPYGNARGQYIYNEIWSPYIPWTGNGTSVELRFDIYEDLTIPDCVFYIWHIRSIAGGCPGIWRDQGYVYYGPEKSWSTEVHPVGDLIDPNATHVQLALGLVDQCGVWGVHVGGFCSCDCHSHSPLFDNVELRRISTTGPAWSVRAHELFQDCFPEDGTVTGTARASMAGDIGPYGDGVVIAGDSAVAYGVSDPVSGLGGGSNGCGAGVYCYVSVLTPNYPAGALEAPEAGPCVGINGTPVRWPVVDSVEATFDCWGWGGPSWCVRNLTWYVIQMDTVFEEPNRQGPVENRFCVDLNDNLVAPPDTILFFFGAKNTASEWTYWSEFTGTTFDMSEAARMPMEFQVLPTGNTNVFYVDKFDGMGAQYFFDQALAYWWLYDRPPDRYDVRAPTSLVGNGPGDRVKNVYNQIIPVYRSIIWNTGDLSRGTIGDGMGDPCDEDDAYVLYTFLDQHADTFGCGLYLSGDDIAEEWVGLTGPYAHVLKTTYITHNLISGDHHAYGHRISPLVIAEATSQVPFTHALTGDDTLIAYGGCPIVNDFDVIQAYWGSSTEEMTYNDVDGDGAVIAKTTTNAQGNLAHVVLSGFSFHTIRDDRAMGTWDFDRKHHFRDILLFFCYDLDFIMDVPDESQYINALYQNYPNPFNPATTIKYSIKERSRVTLKIYNVAGQLVRTLIDREQHPSEVRPVVWDGRSDTGQPVASGVYFYKLVTKGFTQTKKMVLLK